MPSIVKKIARSIPPIRRFAIAVRSITCPTTNDLLQQMVRKAAKHVDRPVFVKVGANDGVTGDPFGESFLKNRKWRGLLIEPVPYCVKRLKKIYSDVTRFTIVQSAVGRAPCTAKFYYVSETAKNSMPDLPEWYDQIGSFNRQHIVNHLDGKLESFIETCEVSVEPLRDILSQHELSNVTLLHIDTEGFDLDVLKSLGLPDLSPSWIMIEHKHLPASGRTEMLFILQSNGYDVFDTGDDFFAMYRKANKELCSSGRVGRIFRRASIVPA